MKRFAVYFLAIFGILACSQHADAQLIDRAERLILTTFGDRNADSANVAAQPVTTAERMYRDSVTIKEMEARLEAMRLTEMMLRAELDSSRIEGITADSLRHARMRHNIDSLRSLTAGVPVVADGDTLFTLYANRGGHTPLDRADMITDALTKIRKSRHNPADSVYSLDTDGYTYIMYGDKVIVTLTDYDALWEGITRLELAERYIPVLSAKIADMKKVHSFKEFAIRAVMFLLVLVVQYLLFKFTNYLFRKLRRYIIRLKQQRIRPVIVRDYELLNKRQLGRIMIFFSNILRYIVLLIQLTFSVPMLFAIFPQTEKLALTIFFYIMEPVKMVLRSVADYVPNLFIILVIWFCIKYLIKGLRYIATEIENEKLKISGFYPDWAKPSFNIIRFLLYAFMVAMIYPYLPGSNSGVFQGISVFVGLIVSLGSSTVIGNIIAGLVITYMRPFKIGDRIKLNETTGNVIEKTPFVTRLRTPKNEVVTIPNSFIMSSHTVNYSASARQFGLIIHTTVTIGYDVPWRQVHQLLINAARLTHGVQEHPKPFVLETELQDYYPCYQINAYIKDADQQAVIMTDLMQNIQDVFNEAGVEIMSPKYIATRDGSPSTIPADPLKDQYPDPA
ncbi:MAG: mechanosensitive ion channel family protein [Muribaculaceae bacterium]|nr:mechanosensitive ion channel family protein [Muribaculaceae bacterium]